MTKLRISESRQEAVITACLLLLPFIFYLPGLGHSSPYHGDESYYLYSAMQMLEGGDFFTPHYEFGAPRFQNPPLFYWLVAISYRVFGVSFFAGRLPSIIAAAISLLFCYRLGKVLFSSRKPALLASLLLAASPLFISFARVAVTDMTMSLFILLAIYHFARGYKQGGKHRPYLWCCVFSALALMTKGPVAFLFIILIVGGVAVLNRKRADNWPRFKPLFNPWNAVVLLLLAVPWYAYMLVEHGSAFTDHIIQREAGGPLLHPSRLLHNLLYYLGAALRYSLPWSVFLLPFASRPSPKPWPGRILLLSYLAFPLAFYAVFIGPPGYRYLMPLSVPFSLLCAHHFSRFADLRPQRLRLFSNLLVTSAFLLFLPLVLLPLFLDSFPGVTTRFALLGLLLMVGGVFALAFSRRGALLKAIVSFCLVILATISFCTFALLPSIKPQPLEAIAADLSAAGSPRTRYAVIDMRERPRTFLAPHVGRLPVFTYSPWHFDQEPDFLPALGLAAPDALIVMPESSLNQRPAPERERLTVLARRYGYELKGAGITEKLLASLRDGKLTRFLAEHREYILLLAQPGGSKSSD